MSGRYLCITLFLIAAAAGIVGCPDDEVAVIPAEHLALSITLEEDTVQVSPGSVADVHGYALMTSDWRPEGVPGLRIDFLYEQPWAHLMLLDTLLEDTTDAQGKVNFLLRHTPNSASQMSAVLAQWGILSATDSVWIEVIN